MILFYDQFKNSDFDQINWGVNLNLAPEMAQKIDLGYCTLFSFILIYFSKK